MSVRGKLAQMLLLIKEIEEESEKVRYKANDLFGTLLELKNELDKNSDEYRAIMNVQRMIQEALDRHSDEKSV